MLLKLLLLKISVSVKSNFLIDRIYFKRYILSKMQQLYNIDL